MKLKNRKGSTLIMTLMIFAILMIFGTFILGFMVNENKMSLNHQYKTQAYYIARSGAVAVEVAIMDMDEDERRELMNGTSFPVEIKDLNVPKESLKRVLININKVKDHIEIQSIGEIKDVEQTVEKIIEFEEISGATKVEIDTAVHSEKDIIINSGEIRGDVTSNNGPILKDKDQGRIIGNVVILNPPKEYSLPDFPDINDILPEFPSFNPSLNRIESWDNSDNPINSNKYYKDIDITGSNTLVINASESNIDIWAEELNLKWNTRDFGNIKIIGNNTVNIHVKNKISINSPKPITNITNTNVNVYYNGNDLTLDGSSQATLPINLYLNSANKEKPNYEMKNLKFKGNLYIYKGTVSMESSDFSEVIGNIYSKDSDIKLSGSGSTNGNIYIENGNIEISGSGRVDKGTIYIKNSDVVFKGSGHLDGNIISTGIGNRIKVDGGGTVINGLIYGPKTDISFGDSGKVYGAVVGKTITMNNWGSLIEYKPENFDSSIINVPNSEPKIFFKPGYFK